MGLDATLTNNTTYSILLRTTDRAGNVYTQTLAERKTFLYDNASPSAGILDPDQPYERSLSIISGTAADSATPISGVEVAISTGASFDYYWSGSNWIQGPAIWMNASAGDGTFNSTSEDWLINSSLPTYINNRAYQVTVRPADAAGNKVNQYTASFVYDTVPATSAVTSPPLLTAYQSLALVTGTMSDAPNPAPQTVELTLMNPSNNFWNGSNFSSSTSVWLSAAQVYTTTWTYTNLPTSWNDRTIYTLFVRSIDRAGNPVPGPDFVAGGHQFRIDFSSPISKVDSLSTSATTYLSNPLSSVTGTASDLSNGSGVNAVRVRVLRSDSQYLNSSQNGFDTAPGSIAFPLPAAGQTSWTRAFSDPVNTFQDGYRYDIQSQATDNSNPANVEQVYTSATVLIDKSTPTSVITSTHITGGYFNNTLSLLDGTFNDPAGAFGPLASGVRFINLQIFDGSEAINPWWTGSSWSAAQVSTSAVVHTSSWTYTALPSDWSHGTNADERWFNFYVQAIDFAGSTQTFAVVSATYDVQPGTASIAVPNTAVVSALTGFRSKNAVYKLINKLVAAGVLIKDSGGKISLNRGVDEIKLLGLVEAGFPAAAEEATLDTLNLDDYLIKNKEASYLLRIKGDSMIEAGIQEGDMVVFSVVAHGIVPLVDGWSDSSPPLTPRGDE
jgi:hypothetical protein